MKNKKRFLIIAISVMCSPSWAAANEAIDEPTFLDWSIENIVLIMGSTVIVGALLFLFNATKTIWKSQSIERLEAKGVSHLTAISQVNQSSFLKYIYRELAGVVPLEKEKDILLNHDYDGIKELDNNLPPWWLGMFYISILYAVVHLFIFHFTDIGLSSDEEYQQEIRDAEIAIAAFNAQKIEKITSSNVKALTEKDMILAGQELYQTYCMVCHAKNGEGTATGPNMTDEYWLHGGGIRNIFETISEGVPEKGMIPWKTQLSPEEIQKLASYILTLEGTNPDNPKSPEGTIWEGEKKGEQEIELN